MATLQVKNLPDEIHDALEQRARENGVTMSAYVTELLRDNLSRPSISDWLLRLDRAKAAWPVRKVDSAALMDEIRGPWPGEA